MKPTAVLFDLYGTVLDFGSLAKRFVGVASAPDAFVAAWRTKQLQFAMAATLMDRYADFDDLTGRAYAYAAAMHGLPCDAAASAEAVAAWSVLPAFPDVAGALDALQSAGIPAAILSNGTPRALATALAGAGITDRFAHVLSVDAVRRFKPHPDVYAYGAKSFDASPDRIAFVSSNGWDATGAAEFGFRVIWCNRGNLPAETFGAPPRTTIRSLTDLPAALE